MTDKFLSLLKVWGIAGFVGSFGFGISVGHIFNLSVNVGTFIMLSAMVFGLVGIAVAGGFHD